ncbi:MAG: hypothetical protein Tsb0015_13950 [Simkaniaceae bacterium]
MSTPLTGDQLRTTNAAPTQNSNPTPEVNQGNAPSTIAATTQADTISSASTSSSQGITGILHNLGSSLQALGIWLLDKIICVATLGYVRYRPQAGAVANNAATTATTAATTAAGSTNAGSTNAASAQEQLQNLQNIITSGDALFTDKIDAFLAAFAVQADDSRDQNAVDNEVRQLFGQLPEVVRDVIERAIWGKRGDYTDLNVATLNANNQFSNEVLNQHLRHAIVRDAVNAAISELPKAKFREIEGQIRDSERSAEQKAEAFDRVFDIQGVQGDLDDDGIAQETARLFDVLSSEAAGPADAIKNAVFNQLQAAFQQDPNDQALNGIQFQGHALQAEDFNNPDFAGIIIRGNPRHDTVVQIIRDIINA